MRIARRAAMVTAYGPPVEIHGLRVRLRVGRPNAPPSISIAPCTMCLRRADDLRPCGAGRSATTSAVCGANVAPSVVGRQSSASAQGRLGGKAAAPPNPPPPASSARPVRAFILPIQQREALHTVGSAFDDPWWTPPVACDAPQPSPVRRYRVHCDIVPRPRVNESPLGRPRRGSWRQLADAPDLPR